MGRTGRLWVGVLGAGLACAGCIEDSGGGVAADQGDAAPQAASDQMVPDGGDAAAAVDHGPIDGGWIDGGLRPPGPAACFSQHTGWADCHPGGDGFAECLEARFDALPGCRSQNDGRPGCREAVCDVDCGGARCVGLPTCDGCEGTLCGIYDNAFVCEGGRWVEVADFGWHGDSMPPPPPPEDLGVP